MKLNNSTDKYMNRYISSFYLLAHLHFTTVWPWCKPWLMLQLLWCTTYVCTMMIVWKIREKVIRTELYGRPTMYHKCTAEMHTHMNSEQLLQMIDCWFRFTFNLCVFCVGSTGSTFVLRLAFCVFVYCWVFEYVSSVMLNPFNLIEVFWVSFLL